jgi:hypothetical protein
MAVSLVNTNVAQGGSFSSNLTVTTVATTAGNTLIAMTSCDDINNNSTGVISTTDNIGGSTGWTRLTACHGNQSTGGTANYVDIWYKTNVPSGITSVTSNYSGTAALATIFVLEVNGINWASPVITTSLFSGTTSGSPHNGTALSSGAFTGAFFVAVGNPTASGTVWSSAANGWTSLTRPGGGVWHEYLIASGSQTPGFNGGATVTYPLGAAVFNPTPNPSTAQAPNLFCMFQ